MQQAEKAAAEIAANEKAREMYSQCVADYDAKIADLTKKYQEVSRRITQRAWQLARGISLRAWHRCD